MVQLKGLNKGAFSHCTYTDCQRFVCSVRSRRQLPLLCEQCGVAGSLFRSPPPVKNTRYSVKALGNCCASREFAQ